MNNYIVYQAKYNNRIIYIGSGLPERWKHCTSGTSHNYILNKYHFEHKVLNVEVLHSNLTKKESLNIELDLIRTYNPEANNMSFKDICMLYEIDPEHVKRNKPEDYKLIEAIGITKIKKYNFNSTILKKLYDNNELLYSKSIKSCIWREFKVNEIYSKSYIKDSLLKLGISNAKATSIKEYFEVKDTKKSNGENCFKILKKL